VATFHQNRWQLSTRIGGNLPPESVATFHQNTQLIRPYLNSCKGQITQETLNLIMFYHNHRRYKSGKRQGKAPIVLLTGEPLETPWWELLRRQLNTEQGVTDPDTVASRPPLYLVTNHDGGTEQPAMASAQAILAPTGAAEHDCRQKNPQAA
jgi:hypothetical protein